MNAERYEAFEACLAAIEKGLELDECLERYPEMAEDLQPLLETAMFARSVADDHIPNAAFHRSRSRLLDKAARLREQVELRPRRWNFGRLPRIAFGALVIALIFFMSWRGAVESAQALPGDPLYPLKLRAEEVRLGIVPNARAKRAIEVTYEKRRVDEVSELLARGRLVEVVFEGELHRREPEQWKIEGIAVSISPDTQILGDINLGEVVKVSGRTQPNGKVLAAVIQLHSYQLIGEVESIGPTQWVVSGRQLRIRRDSQIDPAARVDDRVIVLVEVDTNENLQALAILRLLQPELVATLVPAATAPEEQSGEIELDTVIQTVQPQQDEAGNFTEGEEIKNDDRSENGDKSGSGENDDQDNENSEGLSGNEDEEGNSDPGSQSNDDDGGNHEDEEEQEDNDGGAHADEEEHEDEDKEDEDSKIDKGDEKEGD